MTCRKCGRPPESGRPTHWIGCEEITAEPPEKQSEIVKPDSACEHGTCDKGRKPPAGRGPKPKYCEDHSDPKNRK